LRVLPQQSDFVQRAQGEWVKECKPGVARLDGVAEVLVGQAFILASDLYAVGLGVPLKRDSQTITLALIKLAEHGGPGFCAADPRGLRSVD
jgi:hypothetical protein